MCSSKCGLACSDFVCCLTSLYGSPLNVRMVGQGGFVFFSVFLAAVSMAAFQQALAELAIPAAS